MGQDGGEDVALVEGLLAVAAGVDGGSFVGAFPSHELVVARVRVPSSATHPVSRSWRWMVSAATSRRQSRSRERNWGHWTSVHTRMKSPSADGEGKSVSVALTSPSRS